MSFGKKGGEIKVGTFMKLVLGGASSCTAVSMCHPIDVLKIWMQNNEQASLGLVGSVRDMVGQKGVKQFTNGLSAALMRQVVYSSLRYGLYTVLKDKFVKEGDFVSLTKKVALSATAGTIGAFLGTPNDLILVRMQSGKFSYKNIFNGYASIIRKDGLLGLWKGWAPTTLRGAIVTVGQAASYDHIKEFMLNRLGWKDGKATHFAAGSLAGLLATILSSPVDVIKTRIISGLTGTGHSDFTTISECAKHILKNEGIGGFYKGFIPNAFRLIPVTIFTFLFYELYLNALQKFTK